MKTTCKELLLPLLLAYLLAPNASLAQESKKTSNPSPAQICYDSKTKAVSFTTAVFFPNDEEWGAKFKQPIEAGVEYALKKFADSLGVPVIHAPPGTTSPANTTNLVVLVTGYLDSNKEIVHYTGFSFLEDRDGNPREIQFFPGTPAPASDPSQTIVDRIVDGGKERLQDLAAKNRIKAPK